MICNKNSTLEHYLAQLAARDPVPGGGSAAALTAALGVALVEMVIRYSLGKGKAPEVEAELTSMLEKAGLARIRLLELVRLDSEAYLAMRDAKKLGETAYLEAAARATEISRELQSVSKQISQLTAYLRKEGNPYLLSDVIAAELFLDAGGKAAGAMVEANQ